MDDDHGLVVDTDVQTHIRIVKDADGETRTRSPWITNPVL